MSCAMARERVGWLGGSAMDRASSAWLAPVRRRRRAPTTAFSLADSDLRDMIGCIAVAVNEWAGRSDSANGSLRVQVASRMKSE